MTHYKWSFNLPLRSSSPMVIFDTFTMFAHVEPKMELALYRLAKV